MNGSATGYFALLDLAVCGAGRLASLTLAPSAERPPKITDNLAMRSVSVVSLTAHNAMVEIAVVTGTVALGKASGEKPGKIQHSRLLGSLAPAPSGLVSSHRRRRARRCASACREPSRR